MSAAPPPSPEDPARFLAVLRQGGEGESHERAWLQFVHWFHQEHYAQGLAVRLGRRIEGQGMLTHFAPCDVLSAFCLRVRNNPALLGTRDLPTRTWMRRQLDSICREFERRTKRREKTRLHPRSGEEMIRLLDTAPDRRDGHSLEDTLSSPEGAALFRDLEQEIASQLVTLEKENPAQHQALTRGAAGDSYAAMAEAMDTTTGTVKSLVHRARAKLKERLAGYWSVESPGGSR